jgi:hypothetical protein
MSRYVHSIRHLALHGIRRQRGLGVRVVDLVAVGGEDAAGVHVRDEGENIVRRDGEKRVVERVGRHRCCSVELRCEEVWSKRNV